MQRIYLAIFMALVSLLVFSCGLELATGEQPSRQGRSDSNLTKKDQNSSRDDSDATAKMTILTMTKMKMKIATAKSARKRRTLTKMMTMKMTNRMTKHQTAMTRMKTTLPHP